MWVATANKIKGVIFSMSEYLRRIQERVEKEKNENSLNHLHIIAAHEYSERLRKEGLNQVNIPGVKPIDWGYKLDSSLVPASVNLPR